MLQSNYLVDMTERCVMCGRSEDSIQHEDYTDRWVCCDIIVHITSVKLYVFYCVDPVMHGCI